MARSNFLGALDKLVEAKDKQARRRTGKPKQRQKPFGPSRQSLKQNLGTRTSKPTRQQDISKATDPMGYNQRKPSKHGMRVGMRF